MPSPTVGADGARGSVPAGLEESADDKSRQRVLRKIFGVDDLEVSRNKAMIRLGVSNSDVEASAHLLREGGRSRPVDGAYDGGSIEKVERVTGYAESQLAREKAIQMLGTTEEDIDAHVSAALGKLGLPASFEVPQTTRDESAGPADCMSKTIANSKNFSMHRRRSAPEEDGSRYSRANQEDHHQQRHQRQRAHTDHSFSDDGGSFSNIFISGSSKTKDRHQQHQQQFSSTEHDTDCRHARQGASTCS